ncbi:chemotaxis protein CheW [Rubellicoccus peritrichatus]|uniref:Chemotaxis protein CheW n=1 Tax=Rubellicoccus peritrichatus TaxID=3080537 RepID=A0AAQ3L8M1_9BACT|nr:chemotaxis protein CheW [Puniceicoccus sp. CR14]WOO39697.1 chemotaxis protein CheW [Puniceicoccus sp. CR14]
MSSEEEHIDSTASIELLDRQSPEGYQREWLERIRERPDDDVKDTMPALVFRVAGEWLAISVTCVAEVTSDAPVHRVPHRTNEVLKGIVNVRGELQLAISLRSLLALESGTAEQMSAGRVYPRMVMLLREGERFVSRVEEVVGVIHFEKDEMEQVPVTVSKALATYTRGIFSWRDRKIAMIDDELLFHSILNKYL